MIPSTRLAKSSALVLAAAGMAWCQSDLTDASLEELLNVKVSSVEKKEQKLFRAAAAVSVITQEDIRRSGAQNIPDLLRMVPGVNVYQINANDWAISIRGFNQRYGNKVLVLVDGRTVYSSDFSGTFWDQLQMPLEDIERIEVIRGPGATVWGANAVNGVISIMTKRASATQGGLTTAEGGTGGDAAGLAQYGGSAGPTGTYRIYSQYNRADGLPLADGASGGDGWSGVRGGFRSDWGSTASDSFTLEGDFFSNWDSEMRYPNFEPLPGSPTFSQSYTAVGGSLLGRWERTFGGGSQTSFQAYYDERRRTELDIPEMLRNLDFDFQDHLAPMGRNDIVWGMGYRYSEASLSPGYQVSLPKGVQTASLFSAFIQDEIRLADSVSFTIGTKLEHNAFSGFEYEPSARIAWMPSDRNTLWASVARAIRQPALTDASVVTDLEVFASGPNATTTVRLIGNPAFQPEQVRDLEAGYRTQLTDKLSLDIAGFVSRYRDLETNEPQAPEILSFDPTLQIVIPVLRANLGHGTDYGGEASVSWNVTPTWRLIPGYAYLVMDLANDPSSADTTTTQQTAGNTPRHSFEVRSQWNVSRKLSFDQALYYDAHLGTGNIPGHFRLDCRLARRFGEGVELSAVGQNLLGPRFLEFGDSDEVVPTAVERSVFGKLTVRF